MIAVRGRQTYEVTREELCALRGAYQALVIDVGAGDGAWAYRHAKAHPEQLVTALDPVAENMRESSARAARKPERGGLANALFIVASIEHVPGELRGVADEVHVTLPWGSLMRGIILGDDVVLSGIAALGRPGADVRIILNTRIFDDPVPIEVRDLPEVTPEYARSQVAPAFARHSMRIDETRWMEAAEVAAIGTTWAKRLSHPLPPRSVLIEAVVL
jgi:16S rRNA (adenine(1408)-N(1))-methyltransferase